MPASKHQKSLTGLVLTACAALVLVGATACGSEESGGTGETPPKMEPLNAVGDGEGELNIIAWAATPRTAPTTPPSTGSRRSRRRPDARPT